MTRVKILNYNPKETVRTDKGRKKLIEEGRSENAETTHAPHLAKTLMQVSKDVGRHQQPKNH
ncbi:MAG: hypothetical protein Fur0046_05480 [Cyanobacteria bacterium J069]